MAKKTDPRGKEPAAARRPPAKSKPVEDQRTPFDAADGKLGIAAVRDMTDQQRAERDRARLAAIMKGASAAIIVASLDGTIENWNDSAQQLFGYTVAAAQGRNITDLFPAHPGTRYQDALQRLIADQKIAEYETVMLDHARTPVAVAVSWSLVHDEQGSVTGVCCMARDVRERKNLEQQIAEVTDQERQRLGRELHDSISQQISGIGMLLATLRTQLDQSAQAPILEQLEKNVDEAKRQLRALTKGLVPVDVDSHGFRVALEDLALLVTRSTGIPCSFECREDVFLSDNFTATQLYLVAREAAFNAASHAESPQIVIQLEECDGEIQISVRDSGRGLPPDLARSDGMGMRIMRYRCGLLGATLDYESGPRKGTIVRCRVMRREKS